MEQIRRRATCRLCQHSNLVPVLPLEPSPIGDEYVPQESLSILQPRYPLTVVQCQSCGHAQLWDVISPEVLFSNYTYQTQTSLGLVEHFRRYADDVVRRFQIPAGSLVVEIGSNDGSLLRAFQSIGLKVLGVDPAKEIAKRASDSGIPTISDFFSHEIAEKIIKEQGRARLVCANNVFAHADDLRGITEGIASVLDEDGVFVFEVSYLVDTIEKYLFDTIYHEHLCYHSLTPFIPFFRSVGLELFDVQRIPTKGGSIRCFVQRISGPNSVATIVSDLVTLESEKKLHTSEPFMALSEHLDRCRTEIHGLLASAKSVGKKIAGFGASITATTLLYHFKLEELLECIIDDNPLKAGLYSPGAHIPIKGSEVLYDPTVRPDIVVILVWQYRDPIVSKHSRYLESGGRFVMPLPSVSVIAS